jgi:hypothetical protein
MSTLNSFNESPSFEGFISNPSPSFSPIPPEVTLYYAAVPTDRISDSGSIAYNEYIFKTEKEAVESGLNYEIATWTIINELASTGHAFPDMIVCTPQGQFIWTDIYNEDELSGELELFDCIYRAYGAPEAFSEEIEEYLSAHYYDNAELLSVSCVNREGLQVYEATLSSDEDSTFIINTLGEFTHI